MVSEEGLEPSIHKAVDFKSTVYTIPPHSHYTGAPRWSRTIDFSIPKRCFTVANYGSMLAGPAGIEPTSPSSKHGILSIELKTEKLVA